MTLINGLTKKMNRDFVKHLYNRQDLFSQDCLSQFYQIS